MHIYAYFHTFQWVRDNKQQEQDVGGNKGLHCAICIACKKIVVSGGTIHKYDNKIVLCSMLYLSYSIFMYASNEVIRNI